MKNVTGWVVGSAVVVFLALVLSFNSGSAHVSIANMDDDALEMSLTIGVSSETGSAQDSQAVQQVLERARIARSDPANEDYAGWFTYLAWRVERGVSPAKLTDWLDRIEVDSRALMKQRGRFEWAHLSKVDGTGQPFMVAIPDDYDPNRAWPLILTLHANNHLHHTLAGLSVESANEDGTMAEWQEPFVQLWPLGRSSRGKWRALSEFDAIEALDYVRSHWNIDPDRIHLEGYSMGGSGTFELGSRHPDWFASAAPQAGFAPAAPIENMLNLPVYAFHNIGDPSIAISMSRGLVRQLAEFGGQAILDELPDDTHGFWFDTPGFVRQREWALRQVRAQSVRRVHYTALDEYARGAYWVEVAEWGPEGRPATIDARIGLGNDLHLTLDNIGVLEVDLAMSPADRETAMRIVIDGTIVDTLAPTLPDSLYILRENGGWKISEEGSPDPPQRLHFPGGSMALYHGEPVMVVWPTQGDEDTNKRIFEIAQLARKSCMPAWWPDEGAFAPFQTIIGQLYGKPDVEVTPEDMAVYNLILLGDASENAVVARIAGRLPVQIEDGRVHSSDGFSWNYKDNGLGLLYYNPLAPKRLVYWVAFDDPLGYRPRSELPKSFSEPAPADFLIMSAANPSAFVAARRFDSRWNWEPGYGESPLVGDGASTEEGYVSELARVLRLAAGADFALVELEPGTGAEGLRVAGDGVTRRMDLVATEYDRRIAVMDLTGEQILAKVKDLEDSIGTRVFHDRILFLPDPLTQEVDPDRLYRVAVKGWTYHYANRGIRLPDYRMTEHTVRDAIARFWPVVGQKAVCSRQLTHWLSRRSFIRASFFRIEGEGRVCVVIG